MNKSKPTEPSLTVTGQLDQGYGKGTWVLTDVTIAGDRSVIKREGHMILQYIDFPVKKYSARGM